MKPDVVNGLFEICGSYFIWLHIQQVLKDKAVAGVSIPAVIFFAAWGVWNLYYYPHLEQWFSFAGGIGIFLANAVWIYLLIKYRGTTSEDRHYS